MSTVNAPLCRITKIVQCKQTQNIFAETLNGKIIRLYFDNTFFEIGQIVRSKNHYRVPNNETGYIVELRMPFEASVTTDVIHVHFQNIGLECFKPKELEILKQ